MSREHCHSIVVATDCLLLRHLLKVCCLSLSVSLYIYIKELYRDVLVDGGDVVKVECHACFVQIFME